MRVVGRFGFDCGMAAEPETERRLLVGFAAGPSGDDALALADVLCDLTGARPTVVRVVPIARHLLGDDPERALERLAGDELVLARDRLAAHDPRTEAVRQSSVARGLFEQADREGSALIIVGSTHRGKLGRVLPGSTASALLHGAPAAVAVAPVGYGREQRRRIERIGVAVDGSNESQTALAAAIELAREAGAELRIISSSEPSAFGYGSAVEVLTAGEIESFATAEAQRLLAAAAERVPAEISAQTHLVHGEIGAALEQESDRLDLLLLGSRGYGPLRRTLLGSVSTRVANGAHCPVLITPRGLGSQPFGGPAG